MMESVEDIPSDAILEGLPGTGRPTASTWPASGRLPKGLNVGGMVGHCALASVRHG